LRATNEEVYEEIRFNTDGDNQHLQQETNISTISIFEFLALLPKQRASSFLRIVSIVNEEIYLTMDVI